MSVYLLHSGEVVALGVEAPALPVESVAVGRSDHSTKSRYLAVCSCGRRVFWVCDDCGYVPPRFRAVWRARRTWHKRTKRPTW